MYLNTTKKIIDTVCGNPADFIIGGVQNHRVIDTPHRGMWGGTPECKLNSGFCAPNTHTFSCTTDVLKGVC